MMSQAQSNYCRPTLLPRSSSDSIARRNSLQPLLAEVRSCRHCAAELPQPPKPLLQMAQSATVLIVGQAPGLRAHHSGIPWNDSSGDRLRCWMQISRQLFYDQNRIAILPIGFCYPGKGRFGDMPPRPECAPLWHARLLEHLRAVKLILLLGRYAQQYYLRERQGRSVAETVRRATEYHPYLPLPHPSPRNVGWLKQNSWFESVTLPYMRKKLQPLLSV